MYGYIIYNLYMQTPEKAISLTNKIIQKKMWIHKKNSVANICDLNKLNKNT